LKQILRFLQYYLSYINIKSIIIIILFICNDNYNDKDIKEQFIENVLDCPFEKIPRVYLVWRDDTSGNDDIFFRASNDGGQIFGNTINLSNNAGVSGNPVMLIG
jgi:hypothetical protein